MSYRSKAYESSLKAHKKLIATKLLDGIEKLYENKTSERRWIWELLQNAKDVAPQEVSVQITLDADSVEFCHNGSPFLMDNITYLIEQVSTKDRSSELDEALETTGKFGTGFMTTHLLSKKVRVQGILEDQDSDPYIYKRFKLQLDRDASTPDEMIAKVDSSYQVFEDLDDENLCPALPGYEPCKDLDTSFQYSLDREGTKIAKVGINDLHNSLCYTLVFIPKIKIVTVIDKIQGTQVSYSLDSTQEVKENLRVATIKIEGDTETSQVMIASISNQSNMLTLAIALEERSKKQGIAELNTATPRLFCEFPLVGSESFPFPVVFNSPLFNPSEPRDSVLLDERDDNKRTFNKSLFEDCLELYHELLTYASACWENSYRLAASPIPAHIDRHWYKEKIQKPMRQLLLNTPIVDTYQDTRITLGESLIPYHRSVGQVSKLWKLAIALHPDRLPIESHLTGWYHIIDADWEKDFNLKLRYNLSDLVQEISNEDNLTQLAQRLSLSEQDTLKWLNQVIAFVEKDESTKAGGLLNKYPIIPNQYGNFKTLDALSKDLKLPEEIKYVLKILDQDWKQELGHLGIRCNFSKQLSLKQASSTIDDIIRDNHHPGLRKAIYYLISCYPAQEVLGQAEFQFRTRIWEIAQNLDEAVPEPRYLSDWTPRLWIECDSWLLKTLVSDLSRIAHLDILKNTLNKESQDEAAAWLSGFVNFLNQSQTWKLFYVEEKILPNQQGQFCAKNYLSFDQGIPAEIKDILEIIGVDYRSQLLDRRIQGFEAHPRKLGVSDTSDEVNKYLNSHKSPYEALEDESLRQALFALVSCFGESSDETRQHIWRLAKTFYGTDLIAEIQIIPELKTFDWNQCNQWILKFLSLEISATANLDALSELLSITRDEATQYLDEVLTFVSMQSLSRFLEDLKVWPNQYGFFFVKKDLKKDGGIEPILKEVCEYLTKNDWRTHLLLNNDYFLGVQSLFGPDETELPDNIAQEIDQALKDYKGDPRDYNFEYPFRLLLAWSREQPEKVKHLLPYFEQRKSHLFLDIYGDQITNDRLFTLMQLEPEKLEALTNLANITEISSADIDLFIGNHTALKTLADLKDKVLTSDSAHEVQDLLIELGIDLDSLKSILNQREPQQIGAKQVAGGLSGSCSVSFGRRTRSYPRVINFEESQDRIDTGLRGEEFVYHKLCVKFGADRVQWMNEHGEGRNPYDFKVLEEDLTEVAYYIDAKSSRKGEHSDGGVFFSISNAQWDFLKECDNYYIAKVFRATSERPNLKLLNLTLREDLI